MRAFPLLLSLLLVTTLLPPALAHHGRGGHGLLAASTFEGEVVEGNATLLVVVNATGGNAAFAFAASGAGAPATFGVTTTNGTGHASLDGLDAEATVNLSWTPAAGWRLAHAACDDGAPSAVELSENATTTCWFDLQAVSHLRVLVAARGGDATFSFDADGDRLPATFDIATENGTGALLFEVDAGDELTVTPDTPAGWELASGACEDVEAPASGSVDCAFVFERDARILVKLTTVGGDGAFTLRFETNGSDDTFRLETDDGLAWRNFTGLDPDATYELRLTTPSGWRVSAAPCALVEPEPGQTVRCDFVATRLGEARGEVENATTRDGMRDVVVYADLDGDRRRDADEPFDRTDADGDYVLRGLPLGDVTLRVVLPEGCRVSVPSTGVRTIDVTAGSVHDDLDFRLACIGVAPPDDDEDGDDGLRADQRGGGKGYWKNWRNHFTDAEIDRLVQRLHGSSGWSMPSGYSVDGEGLTALIRASEGQCVKQYGKSGCFALRVQVQLAVAGLNALVR